MTDHVAHQDHNDESLAPQWSRVFCGGVCAVIGVSALAGGVASVLPLPKPAWAMFLFEPVHLLACVLGLMFARGRFNNHAAMTLLSIAGVFILASPLAFIAIRGERISAIFGPVLLLRTACGIALAATAGALVLNRKPATWRPFLIGSALLAPLGLVGGLFITGIGRGSMQAVLGMAGFAGFMVQLVLFMVVTALLAAGVHLVVRAFEQAQTQSRITE